MECVTWLITELKKKKRLLRERESVPVQWGGAGREGEKNPK